jgi:hypothetical protein
VPVSIPAAAVAAPSASTTGTSGGSWGIMLAGMDFSASPGRESIKPSRGCGQDYVSPFTDLDERRALFVTRAATRLRWSGSPPRRCARAGEKCAAT